MQDKYFIQNIVEHPNDSGPRLVYADFLEENGRAEEAEQIRLGVENKSKELHEVEDLLGKTVVHIDANHGEDRIVFTLLSGEKYLFYHSQSCCEHVSIEDIIGDLDDLIGQPLTMAEEETSDEIQDWEDKDEYRPESFTWTFYRFATIKGYVTIRWYGSSNGYYSERVDFVRL